MPKTYFGVTKSCSPTKHYYMPMWYKTRLPTNDYSKEVGFSMMFYKYEFNLGLEVFLLIKSLCCLYGQACLKE